MKAEAGLYDPAFEHDACGVAFVARLDGAPDARGGRPRRCDALEHLEHRGAAGADADTGDGAGILVQIPHAFLRGVGRSSCRRRAATASPSASCRRRPPGGAELEQLLEETVEAEGQTVIGWRDVPVDRRSRRRARARCSRRVIRQLFVGARRTLAATRTRSSGSST